MEVKEKREKKNCRTLEDIGERGWSIIRETGKMTKESNRRREYVAIIVKCG